jgi:hypothetical protein
MKPTLSWGNFSNQALATHAKFQAQLRAGFYVWNRTDGPHRARGNSILELCSSCSLSAFHAKKEGCPMNLNLSIGPLVSLIAGILILVVPRLLNYIVAIYLIVIGLLGLFGGSFHLK